MGRVIYGQDERFTARLCVTLASLETLIRDLESAGFPLVACDFHLPFRHSLQISGVEEFKTFELVDLSEVSRIFFTAEGELGRAQGSFPTEHHGSCAYSTPDRAKYFILKAIFQEFRETQAAENDPSGLFTPRDAPVLSKLFGSANESSPEDQPFAGEVSTAFPADVPPVQGGTAVGRPHTTRNKVFGTLIGIIGCAIAAIALLPGFRQAKSSEQQSATGARTLALEEGAQFSMRHYPTPDTPKEGSYAYETFEFKNVGRAVARNVVLICGMDRSGPKGALGTIAAGDTRVVPLKLSIDPNDLLHRDDVSCLNQTGLTFDDDRGTNTISFDAYGNEHAVDPRSTR